MKLSSGKISSYTKSCSNGFSFDEIVYNATKRKELSCTIFINHKEYIVRLKYLAVKIGYEPVVIVNKISHWNNMQVEWLNTAEVFKIFPNINSKTKRINLLIKLSKDVDPMIFAREYALFNG